MGIKLPPAYYDKLRADYGRKLPGGGDLSWDTSAEYHKRPLPDSLVRGLALVADDRRDVGPLRHTMKNAKTLTHKGRRAEHTHHWFRS